MILVPGISTGIHYRRPIGDCLPAIREAGFTLIEVSTAPDHFAYGSATAVRQLAAAVASEGLRVHSLHAPFGHDIDITSESESARRHALDKLKSAADALAALGGKILVVHPGSENPRWAWEREPSIQRAVHGMRSLAAACSDRGLTLAIETALPHLLGGNVGELDWILEQVPGAHVGVCIDTSHCSLGGTLFDAFARFAPRLVHLQASDNHGVTDDHLPPGNGLVDWPRVRATLDAVHYRGCFMLEISGDDDVRKETRAAAASAQHALDPARVTEVMHREAAALANSIERSSPWSYND